MSPLPSSISTRWREPLERRQQRGQQGEQRAVDEDHLVVGVVDDVGELLGEQPDVERVQDTPGARRGEVQLEVAGGVPRERRHPAVIGDAERVEHAAEAPGAVGPVAVGDRARGRPAVAVTTSLCPKYFSARSNRWVIESGMSCISPFMECRSYCSPARPEPASTSRQARPRSAYTAHETIVTATSAINMSVRPGRNTAAEHVASRPGSRCDERARSFVVAPTAPAAPPRPASSALLNCTHPSWLLIGLTPPEAAGTVADWPPHDPRGARVDTGISGTRRDRSGTRHRPGSWPGRCSI